MNFDMQLEDHSFSWCRVVRTRLGPWGVIERDIFF